MDDTDDGTNARAPRKEDLVRLCRALNAAGARYVLIGGFAVISHGGGRTTKDIDLLIDDGPENVARVKAALSILADNAAADIDNEDVRRYTVVRVADEIVVDLMGRACGLDYAAASADALSMEIDGVTVPVASVRTLIRTKDTVRPSDALDRRFLEGLLREEE